jgi:polyhydroxybutyrate depolymerase
MVVLHGTGGTPRLMAKITGFNAIADRQGFFALYPQALGVSGTEDPKLGAAWNAGPGLGCDASADADDVGFLRGLVKKVLDEHSIDPRRIHLCGFSNGGRMVYRTALEASDLFASVAVVSGAWNGLGKAPERPVSTLMIHGSEDEHIPFTGGFGSKGRVVENLSQRDILHRWSRLMACDVKAKRRFQFAGTCDQFQKGATEIIHWTLPGGHAWPGGWAWSPNADVPLLEPSASDLIWEFFSAHPMESA